MMDYSEIIAENCKNKSKFTWWPKFAYHYTDVTNVISILSSGHLYSRVDAQKMSLMKNDNASRQVIDMTETEALANVRFYFRPLTPTQYHNEGYKHLELRYYGDQNANVPVPVFLLFNLEKLLQMPLTEFSEQAQSGHGTEKHHGLSEFEKLDFAKIYSCGPIGEDRELLKYRHAEILYPNSFSIDSCLQFILCRNDIERTSLLNLLREQSSTAFYKYKDKIKVCKDGMFEKNGLFVSDYIYHNGTLSISFSNTYDKQQYDKRQMKNNCLEKLSTLRARAQFDWVNGKKTVTTITSNFELDYLNTRSITFSKLPEYKDARSLKIKLLFGDNIMCYLEQSLAESELL